MSDQGNSNPPTGNATPHEQALILLARLNEIFIDERKWLPDDYFTLECIGSIERRIRNRGDTDEIWRAFVYRKSDESEFNVPAMHGVMMSCVHALCAMELYSEGGVDAAWMSIAEANFWFGVTIAKTGRNDPRHTEAALAQAIRSSQGRTAVAAKLANDKKQTDKAFVFERWQDWRSGKTTYAKKADFARDMLDKCEHLKNQNVIVGWCGEWEKNHTVS